MTRQDAEMLASLAQMVVTASENSDILKAEIATLKSTASEAADATDEIRSLGRDLRTQKAVVQTQRAGIEDLRSELARSKQKIASLASFLTRWAENSCGASLANWICKATADEAFRLAPNTRPSKVMAIKIYFDLTGDGLREAKCAIDTHWDAACYSAGFDPETLSPQKAWAQ
jgi:hypothetical protein